MLKHSSEVKGYAIHASDGLIGTVSDFLFDDATWIVRWFMVDTGHWLPGRKVLLPPSAVGCVNHIERLFNVALTRQQVNNCPGPEAHEPVSRQHEASIYDYYGWSTYWGTSSFVDALGYGDSNWGISMTAPLLGLVQRENGVNSSDRSKRDPDLRSIEEMTGYDIHALDGDIGIVDNFLVEDDDWSIRYLVVETSKWWLGNKVLVSPLAVRAIQYTNKQVHLGIDRQRVKNSPTYDPFAVVDVTHEKTTHKYVDDHRLRAR